MVPTTQALEPSYGDNKNGVRKKRNPQNSNPPPTSVLATGSVPKSNVLAMYRDQGSVFMPFLGGRVLVFGNPRPFDSVSTLGCPYFSKSESASERQFYDDLALDE